MQRWRGTPLAKLQVSMKKEAACAKRWQRFHAKVLDATMVNLPEHASSDFVAELSDLMCDHAWWDAVEEKHTELLNDRAGAPPSPSILSVAAQQLQVHPLPQTLPGRDRSVAAESNLAPTAEGAHATHSLRSPTLPAFTRQNLLLSQKNLLHARLERSAMRSRRSESTTQSCSCSPPVSCACARCSSNKGCSSTTLIAATPHTPPSPHCGHTRQAARSLACMCRPPHRQYARPCRPATTSRARRKHLSTPRSQRRYAPMWSRCSLRSARCNASLAPCNQRQPLFSASGPLSC